MVKSLLTKLWHIIRIIHSRALRDGILRESSALTYQSTLAIVPLLAVLFGIAQGFGLETLLTHWLSQQFADHQEVLNYLLQFSQSSLQNAKGSVIAGFGVVFLVITAFRLLVSIETVMNSMWGISQPRPWSQRLGGYLVTLVVGPFLLATSSSITICISAYLARIVDTIPFGAVLTKHMITFIPLITSAILFSFLLYTIPNAPVRGICALCVGTIAAILFQWLQTNYLYFQIHFTHISAIYGSFLALPLFLVWLWLSWLTLLVAGEILVFVQEKGWKDVIHEYDDTSFEKASVDVALLHRSIAAFQKGDTLRLSKLYTQHIGPAQAIARSMFRLSLKKLVYLSPQGRDIVITPNVSAFSYRLSDCILPTANHALFPEAQRMEKSVSLWNTLLATCEDNPTIGQLGQEL
jgi:membrane protein